MGHSRPALVSADDQRLTEALCIARLRFGNVSGRHRDGVQVKVGEPVWVGHGWQLQANVEGPPRTSVKW